MILKMVSETLYKHKQRRRLKHEKTRLFKRYDPEVICWNDAENINVGIDLLFEIHNKRHIESDFNSEINRFFNKDVALNLYRKDILRLYFLKINEEFVSTMYCFKFNNKMLYYQTDYDPKWLKLSALKVLIYKVIEQSIEANIQEFDHGRGLDQ